MKNATVSDMTVPDITCVTYLEGGSFALTPLDSLHECPRAPLPTEINLSILQTDAMVTAYLEYSNRKVEANLDLFPWWLLTSGQIKKRNFLEEVRQATLTRLHTDLEITKDDLKSCAYPDNPLVQDFYKVCREIAEYNAELQCLVEAQKPTSQVAYQQQILAKTATTIFIVATRRYNPDGTVKFEYTEEEIGTNPYFFDQMALITDMFGQMVLFVTHHLMVSVEKSRRDAAVAATLLEQLGPAVNQEPTPTPSPSESKKNASASPPTTRRKLGQLKPS